MENYAGRFLNANQRGRRSLFVLEAGHRRSK